MSDIIRLLPDSVANQIAAGEVIQRPASIVKELMENAIDAGAHHVQIVIVDAGKACVQVIDDGKGMSVTDARLAFERHATSKITCADDLFSLRTMGFRGEALPSIAAVAQVELKTRMADDEVGTCLHIEGSKVLSQEVTACPVGANFAVRNIFFNVPARRKFLKSNQTEMNNILAEFERVVLAHPDVAFTLYNGEAVMQQLEAGNFRQRIVSVFGKRLDNHLLPVEVQTPLVTISGFVGTPEAARKKCSQQYFFANGRFMRHPYFAKAILSAYDRLVPDGDQVPFFLNINVDPSRLDVNIHPAKTEIKFQDDQAIWQIILAAVREALGKFNAVPTIDFDTENRPDIPTFPADPTAIHQPQVHLDPTFNPFERVSRPVGTKWQAAFNVAQGGGVGELQSVPAETQPDASSAISQNFFYDNFSSPNEDEEIESVSQFRGRYVVATTSTNLYVIDQHRAHCRILYDLYIEQLTTHRGVSQGMLFPQVFQLSPSLAATFEALQESLANVGFDISPLGAGSYSINGIPAGTEGLDPTKTLQNILEDATLGQTKVAATINHTIALTLSRQAAMPIGQALSEAEMRDLVIKLRRSTNANYAPDGKLIRLLLSPVKLEELLS